MKKNWTVKVAALMLALTMITACFVGSTFAKYVTRAEGQDEARVAKWGIIMSATGEPGFKTEYEADDPNYTDPDGTGLTVKSDNGDKVVAPGTKSDGVTVTIQGTPEVAFALALDLSNTQDIVLPKGEYTDYTRYYMNDQGVWGYHDKINLAEDYHPIQYTLTIDIPGIGTASKTGTLEEIVAALNNFANSDNLTMQFPPLTNVEGSITLSWEWPFEQNMDAADTYLGNVAAGVVTDANAVTNLVVDLTASATQID